MVRSGSPGDGDGVEPVEDAAVKAADAGTDTAGGEAEAADEAVDGAAEQDVKDGPRLARGPLGAALSGERKVSRLEKRREKIRAEIERNRQGGHKIPTWVLAVALVALVAAWVALIVFA